MRHRHFRQPGADEGAFPVARAGWVEGGSHRLVGPALLGGSPTVSATTSLDERMLLTAEDTVGSEQRTRVMVAVMQTQQRFLESSGGVCDDAADQVRVDPGEAA